MTLPIVIVSYARPQARILASGRARTVLGNARYHFNLTLLLSFDLMRRDRAYRDVRPQNDESTGLSYVRVGQRIWGGGKIC